MIRLTPRLCRAARALLGFNQSDLSSASGVSKSTIGAFETKSENARLATMNNRALVEAFASAGLTFVAENGGGAGLRFAKKKDADTGGEK
jgi:DNA-binding XRE family transcriptional regulator